ncbi:hypothetical protein VdG1_02252 [Verticillium dahliae VDG1]|nr:hypothetical protein VdG1_02252 [Verticillium dahliae VDG1]
MSHAHPAAVASSLVPPRSPSNSSNGMAASNRHNEAAKQILSTDGAPGLISRRPLDGRRRGNEHGTLPGSDAAASMRRAGSYSVLRCAGNLQILLLIAEIYYKLDYQLYRRQMHRDSNRSIA